MVKWTYPKAQKQMLESEGGYSNDAHDPGGVTLNGIIQVEYNKDRKERGLPQKALTKSMLGTPEWIAERDNIYWKKYAVPMRYEEQEAGVDYTLYDYGINSGIGRSGKVLRRVVGLPSNTSVVTAEVMEAVKKRDPIAIINAINDERVKFLKSLSTCEHFCKGWLPRVARVRKTSVDFNKGIGAPTVIKDEKVEPTAKATVPEPTTVKNVIKGSAPTAGVEEAVRDGAHWYDWIVGHPFETAGIILITAALVYVALRLVKAHHKHVSEEPMPDTIVVPATVYSPGG